MVPGANDPACPPAARDPGDGRERTPGVQSRDAAAVGPRSAEPIPTGWALQRTDARIRGREAGTMWAPTPRNPEAIDRQARNGRDPRTGGRSAVALDPSPPDRSLECPW